MIDNVIFDVGNVLLDWNPRYLYRKLLPSAADVEHFLEHICTPAWNAEQDRGRRWADAVAELSAQHPHYADLIRAFDERWHETIGGPFDDSVEILRELAAADVPLFALTNFSGEKFAEVRERYDFFSLFRGIVVSGDEKQIKPDAKIYRILLERYSIDPARAMFIDDSKANVAAAAELGMTAVHFTDAGSLRAALLGLNLLR